LPDGTIHNQINGFLAITYSTDPGKSVTVNASGPGDQFFFPNGDFRFVYKGLNSFTLTESQAEALGVPQISLSAGPVDVTVHTDGTISGYMGNIIRDVCAELE
jgi:hypothetical protein